MSSVPDVPPENPIVAALLAWSRRIDEFWAALFPAPMPPTPSPPPVSVGTVTVGRALAGTALSLWSNLDASTGDKLTAQMVSGSDGNARLVVSMTGMRDKLSDALMGNTGWLNPIVSDFIDQAYEDWGLAASGAEIMLVGFSNGGQQMQNYAAAGKYGNSVTVLLLFGAPLTKTANEIIADSLLIKDLGDNTYSRYTHGDAVMSYDSDDLDRKTTFSTGQASNEDTHNLATYQTAAVEFDNSANGGHRADWAALASDLERFAGTVALQPRSIRTT
jgi:hypothetical protein